MSNEHTSNSFAHNDNLLDQNITETTDIIELADEQLEAVAGGFSFGEFVSTVGKVASWVSPVGLVVSHAIIPTLAAGKAASAARHSGGKVDEAAKGALIDAHKDPFSALKGLFH